MAPVIDMLPLTLLGTLVLPVPLSPPQHRLALERAGSAAEAVDVITSLLEAHGQGGPCEEEGELGSLLVAEI